MITPRIDPLVEDFVVIATGAISLDRASFVAGHDFVHGTGKFGKLGWAKYIVDLYEPIRAVEINL
jgi:hypothetical protein